MNLLYTVIRGLLVLVSYMGYCHALEKRTGVHIYFTPMLVMSSQVLLLFCAGLLNMLRMFTILVFLGGLVLFAEGIRRHGKGFFSVFAKPGFVFFAVAAAILFSLTYEARVTRYDDYSHWALIVKQMLLDNRYPNFQNVITFQSYPPGSATFIYYFCKLAGEGEGVWLFAQTLLELAFILPLFVCCEDNNPVACVIFALLFTNFILVFNVSVYTLLVDTLLPLVGSGGLFFIYYYRKTKGQNVPTDQMLLLSIPICALCLLIKNSGIFFAALISAAILWQDGKRPKLKTAVIAVLPYLSLLLWQRHCGMVFVQPELTKHAMTFKNLSAGLGYKSLGMVVNIAVQMILFSLKGKEFYLTLLLLFVGGVSLWKFYPELTKKYGRAVVAMAVIYFIYEVGLLFMYIFSMPPAEASKLASAERYRRSILIVFIYIAALFAMCSISQAKGNRIKSSLTAILPAVLITGMLFCDKGSFASVFQRASSVPRDELQAFVEEHQVPEGESYYLCLRPSGLNGMENYVCRYLLLSNQVADAYDVTAEQLDLYAKAYRYLLIMDEENPAIQDWVARNYPDQQGQSVVDMNA